MAPRRILHRKANDGIHDDLTDARPSGLAFIAGVELLRHEFPMPAQDRVWRDDGYEFQQSLAADGVGAPFHSGTPTESAMAGALNIRLAGPRDQGEQKLAIDWIGVANEGSTADATDEDINKGLLLYVNACLFLMAVIVFITVLITQN